MKQIWKFPLETTDSQKIEMPVDAEILTVQLQNGVPCIWAIVNTDAPTNEYREILIFGTGHDVENQSEYIGTYQLGCLVFHAFEAKQTKQLGVNHE